MAENPNDFALVVGIEHYPNHTSLKGPIADATWFKNWLVDPQGGGLEDKPGRCELVVSEAEPVKPMHEDIDDALLRILEEAKGGAGRFYFFFSGHGLSNKRSQTNLCLAKWSRPRRNMALSHQAYADLLSGWAAFDEIVMVLDCCRVSMHGVTGLPSTIGLAAARTGAGRSRFFTAFATEFLETAHEDPDDETLAAESQVRGNLTQALKEGLSGTISEPDGGVTADALTRYLRNNVPRIAKANNNRRQKPEVVNGLEADERGRSPIFGAALPPHGGVEVLIEFADSRRGNPVRLEGPNCEILERAAVGTRDWPERLRLAPALHMLIDETTGDELAVRVTTREAVQRVRF